MAQSLLAKKYCNIDDFYKYPIPSSLLGIHKVSGLRDQAMYWNYLDVKHKCYFLPVAEDEFLCVPVLHCV